VNLDISNNNQITINNANNLINQNFNKQNYSDQNENRKKNIEATKKEFNDLADFLNIKSSDEKSNQGNNSNNFFKVDLFSNKNRKSAKNNNNKEEDDDIIEIERDDNENIKKVKNMFDDFDLNTNNDEDDLLELMDLACKK